MSSGLRQMDRQTDKHPTPPSAHSFLCSLHSFDFYSLSTHLHIFFLPCPPRMEGNWVNPPVSPSLVPQCCHHKATLPCPASYRGAGFNPGLVLKKQVLPGWTQNHHSGPHPSLKSLPVCTTQNNTLFVLLLEWSLQPIGGGKTLFTE